MRRAVIAAFMATALSCRAFDAAPLVQYCEAPAATGDWWNGLELSRVWRVDDGAGTNVAASYGGVYPGNISGYYYSWQVVGGLTCLRFNKDPYALGNVRLLFPPSVDSAFNLGNDTTYAMGGWVRSVGYAPSGAAVLMGTSSTMAFGS
jgi:hypothetical protein